MPRRRKRARSGESSLFKEAEGDGRKRFEAYYRAQLLGSVVRDENDFTEMMTTFDRALPATFRFTKESGITDKLEAELQGLTTPSRLEWLNRRGWRLPIDRNSIRKLAELRPLHLWLQALDEAGEITRQEAVSMAPPLFLQAKPGEFVLDTCAAPGSKSSQIIEELADTDGTKDGFLVANDSSLPRAHTLVHQIKRLSSSRYAVTHCDARQFPGTACFDRILCDVPCSGDGTARKLPPMIHNWNSNRALSLHALQTDIAKRAFGLLKQGGRLVYSTCSLNPIENEAVVAALLAAFSQDIELIDASDIAPKLKRRPGLITWHVFEDLDESSNTGGTQSTYFGLRKLTAVKGSNMRNTIFPPSDPTIAAQLVKTMRFLPHDDDSGAFFVAVFFKKSSIMPNIASTQTSIIPASRSGSKKPKPEDMRFVELSTVANIDAICDFYGLTDPTFPRDCLLTREVGDGDAARKIILVSRATKNFILSSRARIVHAGVNVFHRTSQQGTIMPYRLAQDGIHLILPFITTRRIVCPPQDFALLLKGGSIDFTLFSSTFVQHVQPLQCGSFVAVLESLASEKTSQDQNKSSLAVVSWRGDGNYINVYCGKSDISAIANRFAALQDNTIVPLDAVADDDEEENHHAIEDDDDG